MKEYTLNEKEREYMLGFFDIFSREYRKRAAVLSIALNGVNIILMLFTVIIFVAAEKAKTLTQGDVIIIILMITILMLFGTFAGIMFFRVYSKYRRVFLKLSRSEAEIFTSRVSGTVISGRMRCFVVDGLEYPVRSVNPNHYGKARAGDEALLIKVSGNEYVGFLHSEVL